MAQNIDTPYITDPALRKQLEESVTGKTKYTLMNDFLAKYGLQKDLFALKGLLTALLDKAFKAKTWEELRMIAKNNERMESLVNTASRLSGDRSVQETCEARIMHRLDINTMEHRIQERDLTIDTYLHRLQKKEEMIESIEQDMLKKDEMIESYEQDMLKKDRMIEEQNSLMKELGGRLEQKEEKLQELRRRLAQYEGGL